MITATTFLNAAPVSGTVEQFLTILRGLDSSVPQDTTTANAQPGNIGWQMFGWSNDDLNNQQMTSQYFWAQAASYLGWPVYPTAGTSTTATQSSQTAQQSTSVTGTSSNVVGTTNTTNNVVPVTTQVPTGASASNDLMLGSFDVTTAMEATDPYLGVPYVVWAGVAVAGLFMFSGSGKGR